ncbi:MAG TPA: hypothetical protein VFV92_02275 [Candidatus Bathyarchaeia archaeon]|nr:hypothetical protein [Candidatus Bathyarchaeia archaeon]
MAEFILSLDPGVTTGIAFAVLDDEGSAISYTQEALGHSQFWKLLHGLDHMRNPHTVCEDFEYRRGVKDNVVLYSLELIGIAKLYCGLRSLPIYMQKAAQGKGYWTDAKLKESDLYLKGLDHGRDACRHLMHWLTFGKGAQFGEPSLTLVEWPWLAQAYLTKPAIPQDRA